jgi:hypothetical protein
VNTARGKKKVVVNNKTEPEKTRKKIVYIGH